MISKVTGPGALYYSERKLKVQTDKAISKIAGTVSRLASFSSLPHFYFLFVIILRHERGEWAKNGKGLGTTPWEQSLMNDVRWTRVLLQFWTPDISAVKTTRLDQEACFRA